MSYFFSFYGVDVGWGILETVKQVEERIAKKEAFTLVTKEILVPRDCFVDFSYWQAGPNPSHDKGPDLPAAAWLTLSQAGNEKRYYVPGIEQKHIAEEMKALSEARESPVHRILLRDIQRKVFVASGPSDIFSFK